MTFLKMYKNIPNNFREILLVCGNLRLLTTSVKIDNAIFNRPALCLGYSVKTINLILGCRASRLYFNNLPTPQLIFSSLPLQCGPNLPLNSKTPFRSYFPPPKLPLLNNKPLPNFLSKIPKKFLLYP